MRSEAEFASPYVRRSNIAVRDIEAPIPTWTSSDLRGNPWPVCGRFHTIDHVVGNNARSDLRQRPSRAPNFVRKPKLTRRARPRLREGARATHIVGGATASPYHQSRFGTSCQKTAKFLRVPKRREELNVVAPPNGHVAGCSRRSTIERVLGSTSATRRLRAIPTNTCFPAKPTSAQSLRDFSQFAPRLAINFVREVWRGGLTRSLRTRRLPVSSPLRS